MKLPGERYRQRDILRVSGRIVKRTIGYWDQVFLDLEKGKNEDNDDNKFSDCAFAGNVHYLVTNDKHFNVLGSINFPSINVISLEKFAELLTS